MTAFDAQGLAELEQMCNAPADGYSVGEWYFAANEAVKVARALADELMRYDTALAMLDAVTEKISDDEGFISEYRWKTGAYHRILGFRPKVMALVGEFNQMKKAAEHSRALEQRWKAEHKRRVAAEAMLRPLGRDERDEPNDQWSPEHAAYMERVYKMQKVEPSPFGVVPNPEWIGPHEEWFCACRESYGNVLRPASMHLCPTCRTTAPWMTWELRGGL